MIFRALRKLHEGLVFGRRIRVLAELVAARMPAGARVLDVGAGSGELAELLLRLRGDITIVGVDVLVRPDTAIPVIAFDGQHLPFETNAFDVALLIDVLHHTDDPAPVLGEAVRVAKHGVILKDHLRDGVLAGPVLRAMDRVGNASHGVRLPYNYLRYAEWDALWKRLDLVPTLMSDRLPLYPWPASLLFGRQLHFITLLVKVAH